MRLRYGYALTAFMLASVLNPSYFFGCGASDEDPSTKHAALAAAMAELTLTANDSFEFERDQVHYRIDLELEPVRALARAVPASRSRGERAFSITAHACGDTKLVATAAACIDTFSMDVTGKFTLLTSKDGSEFEPIASDVAVTGTLRSLSRILGYATLELAFDGGQLEFSTEDGKTLTLGATHVQNLLAGR